MTSLAPSPQIVAMVFLFVILACAVADIVDRRKLPMVLAVAAVVQADAMMPLLVIFFWGSSAPATARTRLWLNAASA